jgi:ABC-type polysaccharide/polyol phosphate export permease
LSEPSEVWRYHTLIANLAQQDLESRHKRSFPGRMWSLISPAVTSGLNSVVFGIFLGAVVGCPSVDTPRMIEEL